jgi:hypothetical protein
MQRANEENYNKRERLKRERNMEKLKAKSYIISGCEELKPVKIYDYIKQSDSIDIKHIKNIRRTENEKKA